MASHLAQTTPTDSDFPTGKNEHVRHLREPHRTRVGCIHVIRRDGACTACGERVERVGPPRPVKRRHRDTIPAGWLK